MDSLSACYLKLQLRLFCVDIRMTFARGHRSRSRSPRSTASTATADSTATFVPEELLNAALIALANAAPKAPASCVDGKGNGTGKGGGGRGGSPRHGPRQPDYPPPFALDSSVAAAAARAAAAAAAALAAAAPVQRPGISIWHESSGIPRPPPVPTSLLPPALSDPAAVTMAAVRG